MPSSRGAAPDPSHTMPTGAKDHDHPSLFDHPRDQRAWQRSRDAERLTEIARDLAQRAGHHGITVANLRHAGEQRGILTGEERGRSLSYLGTVMRRAGLVPTNQMRRSDIPRSHGNLQRVWVAPHYGERVSA